MGHIFISHVERDAAIMQQIAKGLEVAGYSTWYFERDVLPGTSYLIQITQAIEQCDVLVLVVSPNALGSDQVTKEVVGAFEGRKPFFPVLVDITPPELKERQPEWRHALGGTAMMVVGPQGISATIARIIEGLKARGIEPGGGQAIRFAPQPAATTPASYTPKHLAEMKQEIRFCTSRDGVRIAYAILGDGPPLVWPPAWVSHLELQWEEPAVRSFYERLARHHTLVSYDRRGTGLSDRNRMDLSLEADLRDLETVIDHLRLKRLALFGFSQSGATAVAYAVKHPRRVTHLILYGAYARGDAIAEDKFKTSMLSFVGANWGLGSKALADVFVPRTDAAAHRWFARLQRESATAEVAVQLLALIFRTDVADLLPRLRVPTLVMHRQGDRVVPFQLGRDMAALIPNARFVPLKGDDHIPTFGDADSVLRHTAEFLGDPVVA